VSAGPSPRRRLLVALAWRPEWPAILVSALAWVVLVMLHGSTSGHSPHVLHVSDLGPKAIAAAPLAGSLAGWTLMTMAMMMPATLPAVRHVGLNSLRRRRLWAMTVYVGSYVLVWLAFGALALMLIAAGKANGLDERSLVLATLIIATGWQLTPWKRRAVISCLRSVPLPPTGWRAEAGCARFGVVQARRCLVSSWPLMLLMGVIGGGNLPVMAVVGLVILGEERPAIGRHLIKPVAFSLAVVTVLFPLLG
jgi:predicted metal-binding membrane protein